MNAPSVAGMVCWIRDLHGIEKGVVKLADDVEGRRWQSCLKYISFDTILGVLPPKRKGGVKYWSSKWTATGRVNCTTSLVSTDTFRTLPPVTKIFEIYFRFIAFSYVQYISLFAASCCYLESFPICSTNSKRQINPINNVFDSSVLTTRTKLT